MRRVVLTSRRSADALRKRWRRLSPGAQALLTALALDPEPLPAAWLVRIARDAAAVDELTAGRWIAERDDGTWSLRDEGRRSALIKLAPWSLRQEQHRVLAKLCQAKSARAERAARHWEAAGDDAAAFGVWIQSAMVLAAGDGARACECLEAAQALWSADVEGARLEELAGAVERCAGDPAVAAILAEKVDGWLREPRRKKEAVFIGRLAPVLADILGARGEHVAGAELRVKAAEALRQTGDAAGAARQWVAATTTYIFALQYSAARETARAGVVAAEASGEVALLVEALSSLGLLLGMKGETAAGRAQLEHALELALKHQLTSAAAEAYRMLGTVAEYASCYGEEQTAFARTLAYCRRHDERHTADVCLGCLSYSLFRSGNWARSRAVVKEVVTRKNGSMVSRMVAEGVLGLLHAHRGELREASRLLEATVEGARQTGIFAMEFFGIWGLALVEEQAGQDAAAALHYRRLLEFWRTTEDRHDAIPGLTCGGLFFADRGDPDLAGEFVASLRRIAGETANPEAIGAAALVSGELQRRSGRMRGAVSAFERALAAFEKRELVIERVRVLTRLGAAQRGLGNAAAAERAFEEAGKRARRLGARVLFAGIEAVENDTGKEATGDPWAGLSPRQRDVARQLCTGQTNKEIAAVLGISVRTVDMHVAHVLKRLGCRTRAEAAAKICAMLA